MAMTLLDDHGSLPAIFVPTTVQTAIMSIVPVLRSSTTKRDPPRFLRGPGAPFYECPGCLRHRPGVAAFVLGDVDEDNHLRMRLLISTFIRKIWLHDRVIQRIDEFVSSASGPRSCSSPTRRSITSGMSIQATRQTKSVGTYYHSESHGKTIKLAEGVKFRAVPCGNRLVVCTTDDAAPKKVLFHVIHNGAAHAPTELAIANESDHGLYGHYLALAADSDRIWFMNTLATDVIYELRLSAGKQKQ